jgi:phosphonate transport system substrate-binding protein
MVPTLVPIIHGKPGYNYGLLCRTGADLDSLRGRELLVASAHAPELPRLWLDRLLGDSGRPRAATWFANVRHVDRLASAVLPVLFGDAAACVVTLGGFDTMREMNPQLGRDLQVLAVSQLLSPAVICVRPDIQAEFGDLLDAGMRSLHKEPEGRQILGLFGIERLVAFDDSHLDPVRELLELAAGIDGRPTP